MTTKDQLSRLVSGRIRKRVRRCLAAVGWERLFLKLRRPGFARLSGRGIEIGAFEHPAPLSQRCDTVYVDAITPEQAAAIFPEIDANTLIVPDHIIDVEVKGLEPFRDNHWDYAIACHVIEHLPNPGRFVGELFRVVRTGGHVVIAAPDKRYTFDQLRPETSLARLHDYFLNGRTVSQSDYEDMSRFVNQADLTLSEEGRQARLSEYMTRREHLSVWTSSSFREFLVEALRWNQVNATLIYEIDGDRSRFEYFGVWQKNGNA